MVERSTIPFSESITVEVTNGGIDSTNSITSDRENMKEFLFVVLVELSCLSLLLLCLYVLHSTRRAIQMQSEIGNGGSRSYVRIQDDARQSEEGGWDSKDELEERKNYDANACSEDDANDVKFPVVSAGVLSANPSGRSVGLLVGMALIMLAIMVVIAVKAFMYGVGFLLESHSSSTSLVSCDHENMKEFLFVVLVELSCLFLLLLCLYVLHSTRRVMQMQFRLSERGKMFVSYVRIQDESRPPEVRNEEGVCEPKDKLEERKNVDVSVGCVDDGNDVTFPAKDGVLSANPSGRSVALLVGMALVFFAITVAVAVKSFMYGVGFMLESHSNCS